MPAYGPRSTSSRCEVHGPFAPVFRLIWEKGVRADMRLTVTALETEARRREQARA